MHNDVVTSKEFLFSTAADISLAAKPLILRDGSKASIRERTKPFAGCRRPIATAGDLTMEVKNLSAVHTAGTIYYAQTMQRSFGTSGNGLAQKSNASLLSSLSGGDRPDLPIPAVSQTSMQYTTSLSPRSWQRHVGQKKALRTKVDQGLVRMDLDALAEYYALEKIKKEKEEVAKVWQRVADHREHELDKLRERALRRMALQAKAGQSVNLGTVDDKIHLEQYLCSGQQSWTGSWTQKSGEAGSLTHNASCQPARLFGGNHRPRESH